MCLTPILIPNPNFGKDKLGLNFLKDCKNQYIPVPCGHCPECIKNRQMSYIQRIQMEEKLNYVFFCTLTYNDESMPFLDVNGYHIRYADIKDVQNMIKRLRKTDFLGRPFRYLAVSELGSKNGRPHFHILFFVPKYESDYPDSWRSFEKKLFDKVLFEWRRNYGSTRKPVYRPLCTYVRKYIRGKLNTNFDLHYVLPSLSNGNDSVSWYVLKYIMKHSSREERLQRALRLNLDEEVYNEVWNIVRPRCFKSLDFGQSKSPSIQSYLQDCIKTSKIYFDYPCFINSSGQTFPLSKFYKSKGDIFSISDALDFFYNKKDCSSDGSYDLYDDEVRNYQKTFVKQSKFKSDLIKVESHDQSCDFNEIYE